MHRDWGECSPRWSGVRSEVVDVRGVGVHVLRADAEGGGTAQVLVHPMGASGSYWLEVLPGLAAYGPVLAPDLPGSLTGHTELPRPSAARADSNARFLRAFTATLGLDRVVVHGWSAGSLAALLFADLEPGRVERLVLVDPTLPGPLTAGERLGWQTLGRLALLVGPAVVRTLVPLLGPRLLDLKLGRTTPEALVASRFDVTGGDLARLSPEMTALLADQLAGIRSQPSRLAVAVTAFADTVSAMYVDRRPALEAIDRVAAPTLLLWGDQDQVVDRSVIDHLTTRRPDWNLHVFEGIGHLPPMSAPTAYIEATGRGQ